VQLFDAVGQKNRNVRRQQETLDKVVCGKTRKSRTSISFSAKVLLVSSSRLVATPSGVDKAKEPNDEVSNKEGANSQLYSSSMGIVASQSEG
jgi:hypothetical protein